MMWLDVFITHLLQVYTSHLRPVEFNSRMANRHIPVLHDDLVSKFLSWDGTLMVHHQPAALIANTFQHDVILA